METFIEVELDQEVLKQLGYRVKNGKDIIISRAEEFLRNTLIYKNKKAVTSIDIPSTYEYNGKKYKITSIGKEVFAGAKKLKKITIPDTISKINERAFIECISLENLVIPSSVTEIGIEAFEKCKSITDIHIPSSVKKIDEEAFRDCESLKTLFIEDGLIEIGMEAFFCSSLEGELIIPNSVKK